MMLTRRALVNVIASIAALFCVLAAGCNGCNQTATQPFPTIQADLPRWVQGPLPKMFTATVQHPDLAAWEILGPKIVFNLGAPGSQPAQTGDATIGPNGLLVFGLPADQSGSFLAFTTVSFQWSAHFRLRGGQDQVEAESPWQTFMVSCLPDDLGRTSPLDNVDRPSRLTVINPCATFSGTVFGPLILQDKPGLDGDTHFQIWPDPGFETFLAPTNGGIMVAEIVPADKPSCTSTPVVPPGNPDPISAFGRCTTAAIADPTPNTHVTVTGPLVVDSEGFKREIHPVWAITLTPPPPAPPPPSRKPPPFTKMICQAPGVTAKLGRYVETDFANRRAAAVRSQRLDCPAAGPRLQQSSRRGC